MQRVEGQVYRVTPEKRSAMMSRVHRKDTAPEPIVRRLLHRLGYASEYAAVGKPLLTHCLICQCLVFT